MNRWTPGLAAVAFFLSPGVDADESKPDAHTLQHNPFNSPGLISRPARARDDADASVWTDSLQGTIVSDKPLANMGGTLVAIGELYMGYELISVGLGTATFGNGERTIVVEVDDEGDDEQR